MQAMKTTIIFCWLRSKSANSCRYVACLTNACADICDYDTGLSPAVLVWSTRHEHVYAKCIWTTSYFCMTSSGWANNVCLQNSFVFIKFIIMNWITALDCINVDCFIIILFSIYWIVAGCIGTAIDDSCRSMGFLFGPLGWMISYF